MAATISAEEHRQRKEESKRRKRRKRASKTPERTFILGEGGLMALNVGRYAHTAQAYQAKGNPDIAYDLVRELRPRHRRAVLGGKLYTRETAHA